MKDPRLMTREEMSRLYEDTQVWPGDVSWQWLIDYCKEMPIPFLDYEEVEEFLLNAYNEDQSLEKEMRIG